ncbi:MAG: hypothetical protein ACQEWM_03415 [Actinomycetota bacterium]
MKPLPIAALAAASALAMLVALDVLWNAHDGTVGPWLDGAQHPELARLSGVVHAVVYGLLIACLIRSGPSVDAGRRFVRIVRWILVASYALMLVPFAWLAVGDPTGSVAPAIETATSIAFVVNLLLPIALGLALIRRRALRVPALLLLSPLVLLPLTIALEAFTAYAHPGYMETAVNVGLALLCGFADRQGAVEPRPPVRSALAEIRQG